MIQRMLSAAVLCLAATVIHAEPSIVLLNGKVFTGDPARPFAEGVAIGGNKIVAVGTSDDVKRLTGPRTRIINVDGRLIIPGINDAHTHPGLATNRIGFNENLDASPENIRAALAAVVDETAADMWLVGTAGPAVIADTTITRQTLDTLAPGRKVLLTAFTGHGTVISTAALAALEIPLDAPDPNGGWYERDAEGKLNGRAHEYAEYEIHRRFAELATDDEIRASIRDFNDEAIRFGITSVQAMPVVDGVRFANLARSAEVPLRIRHIVFPATAKTTFRTAPGGALKWILDGTPIERGAALRTATFADGTRGRLNFRSATQLVRMAKDREVQLLLHTSGDKAVEQALSALLESPMKRPRLEHADGLQPDLYPEARKAGIVAVLNPTHFPFRAAYPAGHYMPAQSLVMADIPVAFGSDGPLNPWLGFFFAVTRTDTPSEAMPRGNALRAYTSGSAFAEFTEKTKGRIAPGMLADIAVLSQDVMTVEAPLLPDTVSVLTIIDGVIVHGSL